MNCKPANTIFSPGVHASTSLSIRLGEDFINQQSTAFDTRFKFTDKEKDTEIERSEDSQTPLKDKREREQTGYSYPSTGSGRRFGARYYDSDLSVWLSVDPMADKYPSTSGYMYVLGNPIAYIDPDGKFSKRWTAEFSRGWYNMWHKDNASPVDYNLNANNSNHRYSYEIGQDDENGVFTKTRVNTNFEQTQKVISKVKDFFQSFGYNVEGGEGENHSSTRKGESKGSFELKNLMNFDQPSKEPFVIKIRKEDVLKFVNKHFAKSNTNKDNSNKLDPDEKIWVTVPKEPGQNTFSAAEELVFRKDSAKTVNKYNKIEQ